MILVNMNNVVKHHQTREDFVNRMIFLMDECLGKTHYMYGDDPPLYEKHFIKAKEVANLLHSHGVSYPYVFPSVEGGIEFEWTFQEDWEVSLEMTDSFVLGDATNVKTYESVDFEIRWIKTNRRIVRKFLKMLKSIGV